MNKLADYLETLSRVNGLGKGHGVEWLFHCGMLLLTRDKWWGDFKFRHSVHEGMDITYFRTHPGEIRSFDDSIKIPAMDDGMILNICDDFLGQTLVVEHKNSCLFNRRIIFAYAHIIPETSLKIGHGIKKAQVIARVCDTRKNPQLPPHLHFSCFEVSREVPPERLNWKLFSGGLEVNLIHPVFL